MSDIPRYDPMIANNFDDPYPYMDQDCLGDYVLYEDHKAIVENLKKAHEQELRKARERGYSDGQDSNYSWRV